MEYSVCQNTLVYCFLYMPAQLVMMHAHMSEHTTVLLSITTPEKLQFYHIVHLLQQRR